MIVLVIRNFFFSGEKLVGSKVANKKYSTNGCDVSIDVSWFYHIFNFYNTLLMEKAAHNNYEGRDNEELNDEEAKEK